MRLDMVPLPLPGAPMIRPRYSDALDVDRARTPIVRLGDAITLEKEDTDIEGESHKVEEEQFM